MAARPDPFPPPDWVVPVGRGDVRRSGSALTIVTWGATVQKSLLAVDQLGADVEVVDLRWLVPWDKELVASSVERTGRCLVVHEDVGRAGYGAEVAAWVTEHCFTSLDAPVARVTAKDCHVAYEPTLEEAILPQADDIAARIKELLAF